MTSIDFNSTPYFDDYEEFKKFVRVLFRPSFAVQARELTQLQTIMQTQITRLGDFNFEEGSIVSGCETQVDLDYNYVKLVAPVELTSETPINQLIGFREIIVTGVTSEVTAKLVNYVGDIGADPATLYVKYYDSGNSEAEKTFAAGEQLTISIFDFEGTQLEFTSVDVEAVDPTGKGSAISVNEGIRYALGFMLEVDAQTIVFDKYDNSPSIRLGFKVTESIVTEKNDPTLLDNALGSPNESAPGAHRYKVALTLHFTNDEEEVDFIEVLRLNNGKIEEDFRAAQLAKSGILTELAKRTYDANGNFVVENFKAETREHLLDGDNRGKYSALEGGDKSLLAIDIDAGRAYVSGYEISTTGQESVDVAKARETASNNNSIIFGDLGAYFEIDVSDMTGYPDIENYTQINLYDDLGMTSNIGAARVRTMSFDGDTYRVFVFDIQMTGGNNADDVVATNGVGGFSALIGQSGFTSTGLKERSNSVGVKLFPFSSMSELSDITYSVKKTFPNIPAVANVITQTLPGGESFDQNFIQNYMVFNDAGGAPVIIADNDITFPNDPSRDTVAIDVGGAGSYTLVANVIKETPPVAKIKSKNTPAEVDITIDVNKNIPLGKADIIAVEYVMYNGEDITSQYILDDGQKDGYYALGKLIPINALDAIVAGEQVQVKFSYYAHSSGDYFTVGSYPTDDYGDIKTYEGSNGILYDLRNAIDFRPRISDAGTDFTGIGSSKGDFYTAGTRITGDASYYLSRIDKVAVDETGNFFVVSGTPAVTPSVPKDPNNGLSIMEITVPAYTFSPDDVSTDYIEHKRFTMDDIGKLENRIENLEYYTALSLLEKETADRKIPDGLGDDRFKNGFIVDSFTGHGLGDTNSLDYLCSIDFAKGELRPTFDMDIVDLETTSITGATVSNDVVTLPYTEAQMINQPYASKADSINPNAIIEWEGKLELKPDHAKFFKRKNKPILISSNRNGQWDTVVKGHRKDKSIGTIWNFWQDYWTGRPVSVGRNRKSSSESSLRSENVPFAHTRNIDNKTVATGIAPFLLADELEFKAENLKPSTRVWAFFDGVLVGNPSGYVTSSKGKVEDEFVITEGQFRAGARLLQIMDSSTGDLSAITTLAEASYFGEGAIEHRESTIVSVKKPKKHGKKLSQARVLEKTSQPITAVSSRSNFADPIAQTFFVKEEGGAFLTSVEVFFASIDSAVPVSIELRSVSDGVPTNTVVPFSEVTLDPDVDSIPTSEDGSLGTVFNFVSPVYVQEDTEYAFVVKANSDRYRAYISTVGDLDIRGNATISKQPYAGVLFRADNSSRWAPSTLQDMKFRINKAAFDISGSAVVDFVNSELSTVTLGTDPFDVTLIGGAESTVRVSHEDHGMFVGSTVEISGSTDFNGITANDINTTHTITNAQLDWYDIVIPVVATTVGVGGGAGASATRNIMMDLAQPVTSNLKLAGTTTEWSIKSINGGSYNDTSLEKFKIDSTFTQIDIDDTTGFQKPKIIASGIEEANQPELSGEKSLTMRAELSSNNPNVSPVIDLSRAGIIAVTSRVNNDSTSENLPSGGTAEAKYVTRKISLNDPAIGLKVYVDVHRPQQSDVELYYKALPADSEENFESLEWVQMTADVYGNPNTTDDEFTEYEFSAESLNTTEFAIKIVMLSTDSYNVPRLKAFRGIALGT